MERISIDVTYEDIIHMVELNLPHADIEDQIATARAVRDALRARRESIVTDKPDVWRAPAGSWREGGYYTNE